MRHRRKGRRLGRSSSHQKALLRNLACSLILTERENDYYEGLFQADGKTPVNPPARKGRIVTTLHKAKEVRPLVEKCITIAKKALPHEASAANLESDADRNSEAWKKWRNSEQWREWANAKAPAVDARRRVFSILRDKEAVELLFEEIAPRFEDRPGGYTRVLKIAKPRLGDAGAQAILEFVGQNDRVKRKAEKPQFVDDDAAAESPVDEDVDSTEDAEVSDDSDTEGAAAEGDPGADDGEKAED